ncbi:MAG: biotin transporter BioY [Candidatus Woesearchaeota archaeon]|jgi:biotin transport system substrate-specific component|nr:biotin transporter BioY [Candidatus Woesearchaeota archaeon]MDP7458445.1 biotin transporter BioY [Candidatus Woesearchaeota archaeon]
MENKKNYIKGMVFAALFAALTAAVSPIKIPLGFTPVPITLQTLMVLLAGALLGANLGALSQFLYVLVGALGLPVFAGGGSGFGALFGPTGGYLFGFIAAAYAVGKLVEKTKKPSLVQIIIAMVVGSLVIYVFGVTGAIVVTGRPLTEILIGWVLPFLIGDTVKLIAAALIARKVDMSRYLQ